MRSRRVSSMHITLLTPPDDNQADHALKPGKTQFIDWILLAQTSLVPERQTITTTQNWPRESVSVWEGVPWDDFHQDIITVYVKRCKLWTLSRSDNTKFMVNKYLDPIIFEIGTRGWKTYYGLNGGNQTQLMHQKWHKMAVAKHTKPVVKFNKELQQAKATCREDLKNIKHEMDYFKAFHTHVNVKIPVL